MCPADANIVQTTYKEVGSRLYDVTSVLRLPVYTGSFQKFNFKPNEKATIIPVEVKLVV